MTSRSISSSIGKMLLHLLKGSGSDRLVAGFRRQGG
jgi:hypothetical protein